MTARIPSDQIGVTTQTVRGWEVIVIASPTVIVRVLPGKGGDILGIVRASDGLDLLWKSPWGLRPRGSVNGAGVPPMGSLEAYPGGWQTIFPNAGSASLEQGTEWGLHGEAWLAPYDWEITGELEITMCTRLVGSPFHIRKCVGVSDSTVTVRELITNVGGHPVEAMWSHHPTFGPPFLSTECELSTSADTFVSDDSDLASSDLRPGVPNRWPDAQGRGPAAWHDLRQVPPPEAGISRLGYLTNFKSGWIALRNPRLQVGVELSWDTSTMPHAWYWLEARGASGFPWYQAVYVLGLEPASSYPGHGLASVRASTGNQLCFQPGETRSTTVHLRVTTSATTASPGGEG